jgi:hypothetical protein
MVSVVRKRRAANVVTDYTEVGGDSLAEVLSAISEHIRQPLDGNFQLVPDLRIFVGKPMQQRFWLKSTALADADAIAMDLQDAVEHAGVPYTVHSRSSGASPVTQCKLTGGHPTLIFRRAPGATC